MKILAFSDLHCDQVAASVIVSESKSADIVVGAGDYGIRGQRTTELFDILFNISVPMVLVAGNHDSYSELAAVCATRNSVYLLEGNSLEVNGITFVGLGGEIPARSDADWNNTMSEQNADCVLQKADAHQVLITHTPPFGYCDLQKDGSREGSVSIEKAIRKNRPALCLCGHIHHSWGSVEQLDNTVVHNLGPKPSFHSV